MSLTSIMAQICPEIGIPTPSAIVGSSDVQVQQLLACSNREGKFLANYADWYTQQVIHTFTTVDGVSAYEMPALLDRFIALTFWDRANRWPLIGPVSNADWELIISGVIATGPRRRFRIFGTDPPQFIINPTPSSTSDGETLAYEYVTRGWCRAAGAVPYTIYDSWQADSNVSLLSEDLIGLGTKWRFKKERGLPYSDDWNEWKDMLDRETARNGASPSLPLAAQSWGAPLVGPWNVQDGNYPGPS